MFREYLNIFETWRTKYIIFYTRFFLRYFSFLQCSFYSRTMMSLKVLFWFRGSNDNDINEKTPTHSSLSWFSSFYVTPQFHRSHQRGSSAGSSRAAELHYPSLDGAPTVKESLKMYRKLQQDTGIPIIRYRLIPSARLTLHFTKLCTKLKKC